MDNLTCRIKEQKENQKCRREKVVKNGKNRCIEYGLVFLKFGSGVRFFFFPWLRWWVSSNTCQVWVHCYCSTSSRFWTVVKNCGSLAIRQLQYAKLGSSWPWVAAYCCCQNNCISVARWAIFRRQNLRFGMVLGQSAALKISAIKIK